MRSKKRSAARSGPPEEPVFLVDESLGRHQVVSALRRLGLRVEAHHDHFPAGCEDRVWLAQVGRRGWIVLTKDDRIRYRETEKHALLMGGGRAFVLTGGNLTGAEMAQAYGLAIRAIHRVIERETTSFVATVGRRGEVTVIVRGSIGRH